MVRKLQAMKDASSGFYSSTGHVFYFDENQDAPANYDMVNLNVCSTIYMLLFPLGHLVLLYVEIMQTVLKLKALGSKSWIHVASY